MTRGHDEDRRRRDARLLDVEDRHEDVREVDGAAARRSQRGQSSEWRAAIEAGDATAAASAAPPAIARYQDSDTSAYLGEHWQEVRAAVTAVFAQKATRWLTSSLSWGSAPDAVAAVAVDGLLPTLYLPGTIEGLVDSLDDLVSGARAVGRSTGARRGWSPAVGQAIGRHLEESLGRAVRTMAANYARVAGARRASPREVLEPTTRFERIAVEVLEQGKVRLAKRPAAKPKPLATPTIAEHEEVLGPAIDVGNVAPDSELTFEPANPIPVGVDAQDAQRSIVRGASAARDYAEAGGAGGALAVDTARERFDALDEGDATALDVDARIDTFLLQLGTLSQNLHHTADALFGSRATIGHVAGLPWVERADELARRALAVDHSIAAIRSRLTEGLRGQAGPGRQRLLAEAQTQLASSVSQTELVEISEQAVRQLREVEDAANTIFAINAMVLAIAASLIAAEASAAITSSLLAALARTSATGATLVAGQVGAVAIGQITEAAINAAFQTAILGDDSSEAFAENLLGSLLAQGTLRVTGRMSAAGRAADPGRSVRLGTGALDLAAGSGTGLVAQAAVRGVDSPVDPELMTMSVTLGHWLSRRIAIAKERVATRGGPRAAQLQAQLDGLTLQNQRLLAAGDTVERAAVVDVVREAHEVLTAVERDGGAPDKPVATKPHDDEHAPRGPAYDATSSDLVDARAMRPDVLSPHASREDLANIDRVLAMHPNEGARLVREYGDELLEYLRVNPLTDLKDLEAALVRQRAQVKERVHGFYEGIDPEQPPAGWNFETTESYDDADTKVIETRVDGPNGARGYFERAYDRRFKQVELRMAFLRMAGQDLALPSMVKAQAGSREMVEGKGSPTVQYVTLYQLKRLGVPLGDASRVEKFHMSDIQNVETIVHLHYLRTTVGGELSDLIVHTASMKYAETTAIQTGYERSDVPLVTGGRETPIGNLLEFQENGDRARTREHDKLLEKYGMTRDTVMRWAFDIDFAVRPVR